LISDIDSPVAPPIVVRVAAGGSCVGCSFGTGTL
jgi:hypothetical protein